MTVGITRQAMMLAFEQERAPTGFLASPFTVKAGGIRNSNKLSLDIRRIGEQVATVVKKCTGPNFNDVDQFTTKTFEPPALHEGFELTNCDEENRPFGVDPFTAGDQAYMLGLAGKVADHYRLIGDKITRHIELQASQIWQTGSLALPSLDGTTAYELDFRAKATHFPTVTTAWSDSANCTPLTDLENLAKVIRADGKINPDRVIMDSLSLDNFLSSDQVKERADIRRYDGLVEIDPTMMESGATLYGTFQAGAYRFQLWTYPATYDAPGTGTTTEYVQPNKVIMQSSGARMDLGFARPVGAFAVDPRAAMFIPGRISSVDAGYDILPNAWLSENGEELKGTLKSCPLCIPVQIDSFGCLTTTI